MPTKTKTDDQTETTADAEDALESPTIHLADLQVCEFTRTPATQEQRASLIAFQLWCEAAGIGDPEREPVEVYDDTIRDLVRAAHQQLLGVQVGSPVPDMELLAAMERAGAKVSY